MSNHVPRFSLAFCIGPNRQQSRAKPNRCKVPRNGNLPSRYIYAIVLTRQDGLHLHFSIGRRPVLAAPGRSNPFSIHHPAHAGTSRRLQRFGARDPARHKRAAREASYRSIRGPHPARFISSKYPKPVPFIRRLLRVSQSSSSRESRKNNLR